MDPVRLLIRMSQMARRPASRRQLIVWGAAIAASLLIAGIEWVWGWPDWLTTDRLR